jgi:hypothetical protein
MRYNLPNRKSGAETPEEEEAFRQRIAENIAKIMNVMLRLLRPMISDLPDPRDPRYITYPKESLFLYGVMMFSMRAESRRNATRFMTDPFIQENLRNIIPGLDAVAHNDTLASYLGRIDPEVIQEIYHALIRKLLRNKEFKRLAGRYIVLVDGSGKGSKDWKFGDKALYRKNQNGEIWLTYVLDAVLVLENGMVIPLCTQFLENTGGEFDKQDCESKAWHRMAPKLHKLVGDGATIIMDGLYASGPVIARCRTYRWEYIITLKDGSMPSFVEDAYGVMKCESSNRIETESDGRQQVITWANSVEYMISKNHYAKLNVVRVKESWTEYHAVTGKPTEVKTTTYQWISSTPLNRKNALHICTLGRKRWFIENNIKTEKHGGYGYEHYFSLDWDVNKAYYYFMKFGHFINVLLMSSEELSGLVCALGGIGKFLDKVKLVFSGFVLNRESIRAAVMQPFRLRFNTVSVYLSVVPPP